MDFAQFSEPLQQNCWFTDKLKTENLTLRDGVFYGGCATVSYDDAVHDDLFELEEDSFWFKHRNKIIEAGIRANPPRDNRIIELGGGNGNTAYYLSLHGFQTAMFEPGKRGCRNAVKRGMKNVVCSFMDLEHIKGKSVESIGLFDVIEHIEHDVDFLKGLKPLLMNNGLLYITVPAHQYLWSASDAGHCRRYSRKQLIETVKNAGYEVKQESYFFWFLELPIFLMRRIPYLVSNAQASIPLRRHEFVLPKFADELFKGLLKIEPRLIQRQKRVPFGASLFLTAVKR